MFLWCGVTGELAANMRTIFDLDADTLAKWISGKVQLKSMSYVHSLIPKATLVVMHR
jgi:hypothetical protein